MMGLLEDGGLEGLDHSSGVTLSGIEEREGSVVGATDNDIAVLVVEGHGAQGRGRQQGLLGEVGVAQVPDVRLAGHVRRHLLETEHGIGNTNAHLRGLRMPGDGSGGSLNVVGVLEDHHGLGGDALGQMLGLLASEVLLEQVDLVVLEDTLGSALDHLLGGLREAEGRVSVHLFGVFSLISGLGGIDLSRPTSFTVLHSLRAGRDSLGVDAVGGQGGDVAEHNLVRVTHLEVISLLGLGGHGTDDLGVGILEVGVSSEVLPLLLVSVGISHVS
mmetsp:Transcript_33233/g.50951  ORF Transcript_33233/g.50951 Transcript_33233/m.50951 type:complete len:273 (+) Transcript_33233:1255-2073(+)